MTMPSDVHLLDCTLRDGGYYNSWDFSPDLINTYLKSMAALPVDVVELGFRSFPGSSNKFLGGCAYCSDAFINSLQIPRSDLRLAVMVNGSDLLKYSSEPASAVDRLFAPASKSPVHIVRIACHVHKVQQTLPAVFRLHQLGYTTTMQLMQIGGLTWQKLVDLSAAFADCPLDVLYFADSLGGMVQDDVRYTVQALRTYWQGPLGFHAHNNMQWALANSIQAIELGVTWIDGTVLGMGRGPGNTCTEYLAIEFENRLQRRMNHTPLLDLISKHFKELQKKYQWGPNPFYYMAGKYGIHPTYVQTMLDDARFETEDILAVINYLKNTGGRHYNLANLEAASFFYSGQAYGSWDPRELFQDKTVLVLGPGPGSVNYRQPLETFIAAFDPVVLALNKHQPIAQNMISLRAACHPVRLLADHKDHLQLPQPLITAASMLPGEVISLYAGKKILDYGLSVQEDTFKFYQHVGILPNQLAIAYVLAVLASGQAKQILLAGFDGYAPGDPRNMEMDKTFALYTAHTQSRPLVAVTPTKYQIPQTSIFEMNL